MAVSTKIIKKRIRSVGNTKKITKAMEMVSAAKMKRAINAVIASRSYANTAWQTVLNLVGRVDSGLHALLQPHAKTEKIAAILISGNKGLCGGFNSRIISTALNYSKQNQLENIQTEAWLIMGKKGGEALVSAKKQVIADFIKPDLMENTNDILGLAKMVTAGYINGNYDKVVLIYTDYISPLRQEPRIKQLLPIVPEIDLMLGAVAINDPTNNKTNTDNTDIKNTDYIFEPGPAEVLNHFLPRLIETQLYQALLESTASEHSARMLAMKNASEAANDMIDDLTLAFNQARQAAITREIAEIAGGKAAIES